MRGLSNASSIVLSVLLWAVSATTIEAESILDVLILYTEGVEEDHFGEDGVMAHVQASFVSANEGFRSSDVDIRLRLREAVKIDYIEDEDDMGVDLDYITNSIAIAKMRDEVGADLVCLHRHSRTGSVSGVCLLYTSDAADEN